MKKLLLISNSTMSGEPYLDWCKGHIQKFHQTHGISKVLFVPYAGVNLVATGPADSYDLYEQKVAAVYAELGIELYSIHKASNPIDAISNAQAISVGGGNTFHLVYMLHKLGLINKIRERILEGMPFSGWSAGANLACPTLRTTNDMPIIMPSSFDCLNLIPFQINPHYLDAHPQGHGGETRQQRIEEFLAVNQDQVVVGLREGCLLLLENKRLQLTGKHSLRVFKYLQEPTEHTAGSDLNFLL